MKSIQKLLVSFFEKPERRMQLLRLIVIISFIFLVAGYLVMLYLFLS